MKKQRGVEQENTESYFRSVSSIPYFKEGMRAMSVWGCGGGEMLLFFDSIGIKSFRWQMQKISSDS